MFKNMKDMFKQAKEMQEKMAELKESIAHQTVQAESGGGTVKVELNGSNSLTHLSIDSEIISVDNKKVLEDLILAAINIGLEKVERMRADKMAEVTQNLNLPPDFKMPS